MATKVLKKLSKDFAIYGGADFLFRIIGFAVFPIYAHIFSVSDFGLIAMLGVTAGLIGMALNMGVNNAVQRFYWDPETKEGQHAVLVSTGLRQLIIYGSVTIFVTFVTLYAIRSSIYERFGIEWGMLVLVLLAILPDQILQYSLDVVRLQFTPFRFMLLSFMKNILGIALGLWLVVELDKGLYGLFGGTLIASVLSLPVALWFIRKELLWSVDKAIAQKIFHFGYPFIFAGLAYWIFGSMDRWLLAELGNAIEVGIFSIAFKFAAIVTFVNSAFGQAWSPYAIKLMRDDKNYRQTYSGILSIWYFLLAILGCTIALFADELLILLTPREYWPAAKTLGFIVMGLVLFGTTQITALGISLEKKTRFLTYGAWLAAMVNFLLNVALIPRYGALGSAFATLITYALLTNFFLYCTQKLHPLPLEYLKLVFSTCVVLVGVILPQFLQSSEIDISLIIYKLLLLGIIFSGAWTLGIIDRRWMGIFSLPRG
jgi:O-antigen/teichoic acid export membrane protein